MHTILTVLHIIVALFLIFIVLLQTGKGANMGSAFGGGGASQTMFGSGGAGNFLTKLTTAAAIIFMLTSLSMATFASKKEGESVIPSVEQPASQGESTSSEPATPSEENETDQ
ncbi:MAG: preprotein translocase subunit SecG [Nitrospinales bacterium]